MLLSMSARSEAAQLPLEHDAYKILPESLRRVAPELTAEAPPLLWLLLPLHHPPTLRDSWLGLWLLGSLHCTDAIRGHLAGSGFQADRRSPLRPAGQSCPHARSQVLHLLTYSKPPCLQVKSRMRNREQYQDFLKCLNMFTEDIITKHELQSLVSDALNRHPDLQVGACSCICRCHVGASACLASQTPSCNCLLMVTLGHEPRPQVRASSLSLQLPKH